jgi:hypothetical protein
MRLLSIALFAFLLCAICGCGGSSSNGSSSQTTNIAGNWQFTAKSSIFGLTASAVGSISQNGQNISGQFTLSGTPCATSAAMTGTVSGQTFNAGLNENNQVVSFTGTVASDGNSGSGSYSAPSGGCTNGDAGTWSGQRTSPSGQFVGALHPDSRAPVGLVLNIHDEGDVLSGSVSFSNSVCFHNSIELTGKQFGNSIELSGEDRVAGRVALTGELNAEQSELAVALQISSSACQAESASGSLMKIKNAQKDVSQQEP